MKRSESGMIVNPITLSPTNRIFEALELMKKYRISGVPITQDGSKEGRLVGILTNRDLRFETQRRSADLRHHDARAALHRAGGDDARRRARHPAPPQGREAARRRRPVPAEGADHRQGHPEGDQVSERLQGLARPPARAAPRSASARTRWRAPRRWSPPTSTCWSSIPRTATRRACSTWCTGVRRQFPKVDLIAGNVATGEATEALIELRRRRGQGRHRRRLDLHDARRRRHRRADDHRGRRVRARRRAAQRADHRRRRHPLLRRHHQGDRRRRERRA